MFEWDLWVFSHNSDRRSKLETAHPTQLRVTTVFNNMIQLNFHYDSKFTPNFKLLIIFFLGKNFWIISSMFCHSFITLLQKNLSQKQWTEKQKHSQENYPVHLLPGSHFQAKKHNPTESLVGNDLVLKNCTRGKSCPQVQFLRRKVTRTSLWIIPSQI